MATASTSQPVDMAKMRAHFTNVLRLGDVEGSNISIAFKDDQLSELALNQFHNSKLDDGKTILETRPVYRRMSEGRYHYNLAALEHWAGVRQQDVSITTEYKLHLLGTLTTAPQLSPAEARLLLGHDSGRDTSVGSKNRWSLSLGTIADILKTPGQKMPKEEVVQALGAIGTGYTIIKKSFNYYLIEMDKDALEALAARDAAQGVSERTHRHMVYPRDGVPLRRGGGNGNHGGHGNGL